MSAAELVGIDPEEAALDLEAVDLEPVLDFISRILWLRTLRHRLSAV